MKIPISILLLSSLVSAPSFALVAERVSVTERIENSFLVVIGSVIKIEQVEDKNYSMKATIAVKESSVDVYVGQEIDFYHSYAVEEEVTHCCGVGLTYLLFLKQYRDGYASSSGRFGAYQIIAEVPLFLDETWMRTSLEHAEVLLFLHRQSLSRRVPD